MKQLGLFVKATTLGGLVVLLPVVLVFVLLSKAVVTARRAAANVVGFLTGQPANAVVFPLFGAVLLIVAISLILGLIMLSRRARQSQHRIEQAILMRVPGYAAIKNILYGLARSEREGTVRPGLLTTDAQTQCYVFVMEEHSDGRMTVFVPSSPSATSGSVQVVPRERVKMLNVGLASVAAALNQWGVGTGSLLQKGLATRPGGPDDKHGS